ncbi:MAG: glycosyltransferase family 2 protein [Sulfuricella sp.]|nr:glycosyltransferase family 2 protein [Sulfuricella sp.]
MNKIHNIKPLVVIPARNESATICEVVQEIREKLNVPVVVVDDTSIDNTIAQARKAGAVVLALALPLGAWGATQAGIRYAQKLGFNCVVTMDADGQHLSEYLPSLMDPLRTGTVDVVIGACPQRASKARLVAWAFFRRLAGFDLADLTSGFRAYNAAAIAVLASPEATLLDYQDVGVLILLRKCGLTITEVPVQMRPRQSGVSRIFSSWWTVGWYLVQTAILCFARWNPGRR